MSNIGLKITNEQKHIAKPLSAGKYQTPMQKAKLAKAAKEFESMMTSMMLKSMTKTTGGLFGENSYGGDYFDTIFEQELGKYMTQGNPNGLADMIYKKIVGEDLDMNKLKAEIEKESVNGVIKNEKLDKTNAISPSKGSIDRLQKFEEIINKASESFDVDKNLIRSVILTESAANPRAISQANAKGLMQLIDSTAADMNVRNVWDPKENIFGGAKYLSKMLKKFDGDIEKTLAAYNAGPGNVEKYNGVPPFEETKNYINRVKGYMKFWEDKS